ncbi:uncharacterized protein LOC117584395 [Drosophila guanche]|uniref:Lipocalin n=1 Tax=Drosophila guanche TaxID=7266 RepID=A0A3B0JI25_DROGU|nr:uncharacterized protein LOC117584395 [Drosophila guanche]SPP82064.1 Hypothetical predicted protein [Drosophila guanche]
MTGHGILLVMVVVCPLINAEINTTQSGTKGGLTTKSGNVTLRSAVAKIEMRSSFLVEPQQYEFAYLRHRKTCHKVTYINPIDVQKILGFWYAYATTPMEHPLYRLECSAYDASDYNFTNSIVSTDYISYAILYYCIYNAQTRRFDITIRILTRNTSPMKLTLRTLRQVLKSFQIDTKTVVWLKHKAYCFEWFIRSNHDRRRHYRYLAPYNRWNDH